MKTFTTPAKKQETNLYEIHSYEHARSCSPYVSYFGLLRDAERQQVWETFDAQAVPVYFSNGIQKFHTALEEFADLTKSSSEDTERQLLFMLESLIQARQLMTELESERKS